MLTNSELARLYNALKLSPIAEQEVNRIRESEPSRKVGNGRNNVSGNYPSRKMGKTIQFESHKVELPFIYQLEHDETVLEFYDQPPPIKINYQSQSGKNIGCYITPDFFVIKSGAMGWVECKSEEQLQKLAQKDSNRYFKGEDNQWHSPPAEEYAQQFGFYFRIYSDAEINWTKQRNLEILSDYFRGNITVAPSTKRLVQSLVQAKPGITLSELFEHTENVDEIYGLIASEVIFIDLNNCPLSETQNCYIFPNATIAKAFLTIVNSKATAETPISHAIELIPGQTVMYDGKSLIIALVGETNVILRTETEKVVEFPLSEFDALVRQGKITGLKSKNDYRLNSEAIELFQKASFKDLEKANRRYKAIIPYLDGQPISAATHQERSLRNWLRDYRQAQQQYGYGYLGLIYLDQHRGNYNRKIPQHILDIIEKFITESYETKKQKRKKAVYAEFVHFCHESGIVDNQIPSYKTFIAEIKKRSGYEQTLKRQGSRAAYQQQSFYWELEQTTPRHGDFPFHICHIDHTQSDDELRCSKTGKVLGRAYVTLLVDAFSRRILATYASFDPPSYRACMMVLRICVKRYGRLPQTIVTDNGKEFHSTYFEMLLAMFECTLKHRPPHQSRYGTVCERLFGTANTEFFHNLAGNTQITKTVRLTTKSVNPKNLSLWSLGLLYAYLCEWAYEVYDTMEHPALEGYSPREMFNQGLQQFGQRNHRRIPYDQTFQILTLPTTSRGKARVQPGKGVKIQHIYYWSNAFRDPEIEKTSVDIRYDPFNAGIAYAYVQGQWVECISEYYPRFKGRSEKELILATTQLRKQKQNHQKTYKIRAKQLGEFLTSVETEESLLEQKLRDDQTNEVFKVIEGGLSHLRLVESSKTNNSEIVAQEVHEPQSDVSQTEQQISKKLKVFKSY
ncbi:TnsA endonuclease N-terminal domain-containing protein [Crocosphaera chwakensis]|uniref:Integrase, catalytic region n=1 Tax=Crocosphaera chwakensis CCY0110 TaxID=391612 RepID=A3IX72_9CHRO|nr:TnsA endonuclease N-terminal domain-containing protein [Crocosphaera chwakensis]EAZ88911.1 Integrase, catalytic region [Crocosphaera chwakensis CCY0110]